MKNIIITGASGGIGRAVALEMLKDENINLLLVSRNKENLESIAGEAGISGDRIRTYPFDLSDRDYRQLIADIESTFGKVDVLINNAGAIVNKPFEETTSADFERVVNTNFRGPFFLIQGLLPLLNSGAHIINISSMGGFQGSVKFPGLALYSASKGALSTLTEVLAAELSNRKISVNCLAIGSVQTAMLEEAFPGYKAPVTPESMAQFISWFALNANTWLNGKVIPVSLSTP